MWRLESMHDPLYYLQEPRPENIAHLVYAANDLIVIQSSFDRRSSAVE